MCLLLGIEQHGKNLIIILELIKELKSIVFQLWVILMGKMLLISSQVTIRLTKKNKDQCCLNDFFNLTYLIINVIKISSLNMFVDFKTELIFLKVSFWIKPD